ncbi:MAG: secondary thiamine-phosphate synthase enzyme YjbQ [Bacteroidota bacterium]|jgi:secondary thiamine-phosphate synthase enzyme
MQIFQTTLTVTAHKRGFHLITRQVEEQIKELKNIKAGIAHILIQHTSAALTLNENADPTVRSDFDTFFNRLVPENPSLYQHLDEGMDDCTSHLKSSILGSTLTLPIRNGRFDLGTWQGIYLCEFRNRPRIRNLIITIIGELNG